MTCKKCNQEMFIDSWSGWVWTCPFCGYVGRAATDEEVEEDESTMGIKGYENNN